MIWATPLSHGKCFCLRKGVLWVPTGQVHYRWGRSRTQTPVSSPEKSPARTVSRVCVLFPICKGLKDMKIMNIWLICLQFVISHNGMGGQTTEAKKSWKIKHLFHIPLCCILLDKGSAEYSKLTTVAQKTVLSFTIHIFWEAVFRYNSHKMTRQIKTLCSCTRFKIVYGFLWIWIL